jgi:hypothetical protein
MVREIESSTGLFEKNVLYVHTSAILTRKKKKSCFFLSRRKFLSSEADFSGPSGHFFPPTSIFMLVSTFHDFR